MLVATRRATNAQAQSCERGRAAAANLLATAADGGEHAVGLVADDAHCGFLLLFFLLFCAQDLLFGEVELAGELLHIQLHLLLLLGCSSVVDCQLCSCPTIVFHLVRQVHLT